MTKPLVSHFLERSRIKPYPVPHPKPSDWGRNMTVCIAAIHDGSIINVSDRMISAGFTSSDAVAVKLKGLGQRWVIMYAGNDISPIVPITIKANENLATSGTSDLIGISESVCKAYSDVLAANTVKQVLSPYGFTLTDLRRDGKSQLPERTFERLLESIGAASLDLTLLVAGFDESGPHIFTVSSPGIPEFHDATGFWAIGSGQFQALSMLFTGYSISLTAGEAFYRVMEAKFTAESAPGVGKETVPIIMVKTGHAVSVTFDTVDSIRTQWEKFQRERIPKNVQSIVQSGINGWAKERTKEYPDDIPNVNESMKLAGFKPYSSVFLSKQ